MLKTILAKITRIAGDDVTILSVTYTTKGGVCKFLNSDGRVFKYTHVS